MRATIQEWLHVHSMKFWQRGFDVLSRMLDELEKL